MTNSTFSGRWSTGKPFPASSRWPEADTPIIMFTARVELYDPFHPGELIACIRAVLRRVQGGPVASRVIRAGDLAIDIDVHRVEAQGGRIWVESAPGKGTVFRFTLPLVQ